MPSVIAVCRRCGQEGEHGVRPNGKPAAYCRVCQRAYAKAHYGTNRPTYLARRVAARPVERRRIREVIEKAKARPCADCDVEYPYYVMQFDHVRGKKLFNLGTATRSQTMTAVLAEIKKCEVVCANCHAIRTHTRGT